MNDLKVHLMHAEVSGALERLSKLFKPGMKVTFIARLPGNGEADVLIGDDHDADELIALVRRRFGTSTVSAPEEIRNQALTEAESVARCYDLGTPDGHAIADAIHSLKGEGAQAAPEEVRNQAANTLSACRGYVRFRLDEGTRTKDPIIIEAAEGVMERIEDAIRALRTSTDQADTDTGSAA